MMRRYRFRELSGEKLIEDSSSALYGFYVPRSLGIISGDNLKTKNLPPLVIREYGGR